SITGPSSPLNFTAAGVSVVANFTDVGTADTHTCQFNWDDGSPLANGVVSETNGSGTCTGTYTYTLPGVYSVGVTVTDDDTGSVSGKFLYVVVYDPAEGSVSGNGWIMSPAGAYTANPALTGKAMFGFTSKYEK